MNTEIKNAVTATDKAARYDESAKRLLSEKHVLAHILVKTIDEFKGMNPKDVIPYIIGTPHIGNVPLEPGLTNTATSASQTNDDIHAKTNRTTSFNTENSELHEGLIRFDIIFYVRMKDGISQIIVNIEAQQKDPVTYALVKPIFAIRYATCS